MLKTAVMQPTYLPWMGYFDLIDQVDAFVFLDDAQIVSQSWGVRNRILTHQGELLLTVPVCRDLPHEQKRFCNARINYAQTWNRQHIKSIRQNYGKAPFFDDVFRILEPLLNETHATLGDLNISIIRRFAAALGIRTEFVRASTLEGLEGTKDERLVSICRSIGATDYISVPGSAVYIEQHNPEGAFAYSRLRLHYQNFHHPEYPQLHSPFASHMSIIDAMMNVGLQDTLDLIRSGRGPTLDSAQLRRRAPVAS